MDSIKLKARIAVCQGWCFIAVIPQILMEPGSAPFKVYSWEADWRTFLLNNHAFAAS